MRKNKFTLFPFLVIIFLYLNSASAGILASDLVAASIKIRPDFSITVNKELVKSDVPPVEYEELIYVPVRFVSSYLGAKIIWYKISKEVLILLPSRQIYLKVGDRKAKVEKEVLSLVSPPFIYQGRTMIPLKWTATHLGAKVKEKRKSMEIVIKKRAKSYPKEAGWTNWVKGKVTTKVKFLFVHELTSNPSNKVVGVLSILCWLFGLVLFFIPMKRPLKRRGTLSERAVIGFLLFIFTPLILIISRSTFWAAMVPIGTSLVGLLSKEDWEDKLVTMSATAPAFGLIFTFLGLGQIIGPAIAAHNVDAIGYGIAVKIEASVCGLSLWIILNTIIARGR